MNRSVTKAVSLGLFLGMVSPVVAEEQPMGAQTPMEQPAAAPSSIKVEKLVVCTSVQDREPMGEAAQFDASVGRVYCWTKLTSQEVPATVKHVWSLDGKQVVEVPLTIKYASMRTWSNKAVGPGSWKVEVVTEAGEVLSSAEFTVSAAAPATPTQTQ